MSQQNEHKPDKTNEQPPEPASAPWRPVQYFLLGVAALAVIIAIIALVRAL